jgi:protein-S-isoprenylcysteine O-methyltransferase Ste14
VTRGLSLLGSLVFLLLVPGSVAGYVPWRLTGYRLQPAFLGVRSTRSLGLALAVAGLAALLDCVLRFAWLGRGTPAPPLAPDRLVVSGLYRFVRNPMYLAVLLLVLGQALLFGSGALVLYAAGLLAAFHAFVRLYEEPSLARRHPADYARYRAAVRRWLPRLLPWAG